MERFHIVLVKVVGKILGMNLSHKYIVFIIAQGGQGELGVHFYSVLDFLLLDFK